LENELENMGFDPIKRDRQFGLVTKIVGAPFILLGQLGFGLKNLAVSIGAVFTFKEKEKLKSFKQELQIAFKKYIEAEIITAETSMSTTYNRQERARAIANYQKDLKDMTYPEQKALAQEELNEELTTALMNARYKKVCQKISCQVIARNKKKVNILSIDGGGIRVYTALIFLFEMEIRYTKNVSTMFDMVGGSGFGGLVAAALNVSSHVNATKPKYSPSDLMSFFHNQRTKIFKDYFTLATVYGGLRNVQRQLGDVKGQMYDGNGLQESLEELFAPFRKMKNLMKPTVITA
jgi:hypothetical protein